MDNTKFFKIVILLLLIINLSTISFIWLNRPPKKDVLGNFFAKELQFTASQKEQFEALKKEHRSQVEALKSDGKDKHNAYFDLLKNPNVDAATINKVAHEIAQIKEKEELATFYHFQKVRAICDKKQQQKFDEIIKEAAHMMAPQREGHRPPREDRENGFPPPRP